MYIKVIYILKRLLKGITTSGILAGHQIDHVLLLAIVLLDEIVTDSHLFDNIPDGLLL